MRVYPLVLIVLLMLVLALALANAGAQQAKETRPSLTSSATSKAKRGSAHVHHKVRWTVYLQEHRLTTRLGRRVRHLRLQLRVARVQLARARHVAAVSAPAALSPAAGAAYWEQKQIAAAETLGRESAGDPWPNCPDPYDGSGSSWQDTVDCENGGDWLDSPGYYRCGLQFDPMWETRFGRLCP